MLTYAEAAKQHGSNAAAARALGLTYSAFRYRLGLERLAASATPPTPNPTAGKLARLTAANAELRSQLKKAEEEAASTHALKELLHGAGYVDPTPPPWLLTPPPKTGHHPGVPTLFLSDWHLGETVASAEIEGVNTFNMRIAEQRVRYTVETTTKLLKHYLTAPQYPGIVVAVGGDMVSGNIHEELAQTNEHGMPEVVLRGVDLLTWCIERLADEFGHVFVPWVVGNHGRLDKKPRCKKAPTESWDWLMGQILARHFASDPRVVIQVSDSLDLHYRVYGVKYLLTHGDQFRGGSGIAGPVTPWMIGDHRKRKRARAVGKDYDFLVMGHWHQLAQIQGLIVNGSLKGYDEYAYRNNFGFEAPQQALWLTHPEHGKTWWIPVKCEPDSQKPPAPWCSWGGD